MAEMQGIIRPPRVPSAELLTDRDYERLFRQLNEQFKYDADQRRVIVSALMTVADRTGTDISSILAMLTDDGRAVDQRFLPQVSAGNVLSLQNVNPLVASSDATNATISIAAHTLQYGFGTVAYSSGTILGLLPSTDYYVYADDPNYAGGAVTYLATTVRPTLTANNGRYFVGTILTAISANTAAIIGATSANPIVFQTGTSHGWTTSDSVTMSALPGDFGTNLNGNSYPITVTDATHFSIAVNGTAYAAYTTGGLATRVSTATAGPAGGGGGWVDDR